MRHLKFGGGGARLAAVSDAEVRVVQRFEVSPHGVRADTHVVGDPLCRPVPAVQLKDFQRSALFVSELLSEWMSGG